MLSQFFHPLQSTLKINAGSSSIYQHLLSIKDKKLFWCYFQIAISLIKIKIDNRICSLDHDFRHKKGVL